MHTKSLLFFFSLVLKKEGSTPRTPALSKRTMANIQHDNSDTASLHSSNRQTPKRTMTIDNPELGDSM
jgi:hypothetical protein